jgi:hypothetical protein
MRLGERLEIDAQTASEKGPPADAVARAGLEVQEVVAHAKNHTRVPHRTDVSPTPSGPPRAGR